MAAINTKAYIEEFLKIKNKNSEIIPLRLNKPQMKLYDLLKRQHEQGKPQRVIILKARQMGFSTLSEALIFKRTATKFNVNSGIIAHKEDATTNLFNMSKLFLEELPEQIKPRTRSSNAKEIIFDDKEGKGLRSKIKCMTAGGEGTGRSDTFQNLHLSEVSSWPHTKETLDGLLQAVPNNPNTLIIVESTAKGYDYFKELWDQAVNGESDFEPLFCAWHELEEYRMPVSDDFVPTEEELILKERFNLDDEQLMWRRWCIRNNCGGDINTFKQEFPASPEEAFLASGECVFDTNMVAEQIERVRPLISDYLRGEFTYTQTIKPIRSENNEVVTYETQISNIQFVEKENGLIAIHKKPDVKKDKDDQVIARRKYSIGGDTAGLGDDYYTAKVVTNDDQRVVATLRKQRIDEDKYAEQLYCLGMYYNKALIGIETNYSYAPTKRLVELDYPNLYVRERIDKTTKEKQKVYGFETSRATRPVIIQSLISKMRDDPESELDLPTLREMLTFVRKENGKQEAQGGYHDDLVMARAIANFISIQQGDANWEKVEVENKALSDLEKFFALDNDNDDEEDYVEW